MMNSQDFSVIRDAVYWYIAVHSKSQEVNETLEMFLRRAVKTYGDTPGGVIKSINAIEIFLEDNEMSNYLKQNNPNWWEKYENLAL